MEEGIEGGSSADERLVALFEQAEQAGDMEEFAQAVANGVFDLIPSSSASCNVLDIADQRFRTAVCPQRESSWWGFYQPLFETRMHEHPHFASGMPHRPLRASTWAEVGDIDVFRRTELYRTFYQDRGIESQLAAEIPAEEGIMVLVALSRAADTFTAEDRRLLDAAADGLAEIRRRLLDQG